MSANNDVKGIKAVRAFDNVEFLNSKTARSIRILCELEETQERLNRNNVKRTILFFGTARAKSYTDHDKATVAAEVALSRATAEDDVDAAAKATDDIAFLKSTAWLCEEFDKTTELSKKVTKWCTGLANRSGSSAPFIVSTGGGPGLMEAANKGALDVHNGTSIGMGISLSFETGLNPYITPALGFEFKYFFTRKFFMINSCAALVALPGGYGTMDEIFEVLTLMQTGKKEKIPIVLFGKKYWKEVVNWQALVDYGTIKQGDVDQLFFTDDVDKAFDYIVENLSGDFDIAISNEAKHS